MSNVRVPRALCLFASGLLAACANSAGGGFHEGNGDDAGGPAADGGPRFGGGTADAAPSGPLGDVEAVVTCDNGYGFGWGDMTQTNSYFTAPASDGNDIFDCPLGYPSGPMSGHGYGPEMYLVPAAEAPPNAYFYVVAWADENVTQGLIGRFSRTGALPLLTGDPKWDVCATGLEYDTAIPDQRPGPTKEIINQQISICNAGSGDESTSSGGWVNSQGPVTPGAVGKLVVGSDNSGSSTDFPIACQQDTGPDGGVRKGIEAQAHWMWYSSRDEGDAFVWTSQDLSRQFLIFRLAARDLPAPPK